MEYTVEHDDQNDVCIITVTGPHKRPQDSQELLRLAGTIAAEHGCTRFLFDMRQAVIEGGALGAYETPIDHERFGVGKHFRIAAVYPNVTSDDQLMENVAFNRGAAAFQIFDEYEAAYEWMVADQP